MLFVVVAMLSAWLGWNASIVHRRNELRKTLVGTNGTVIFWQQMEEWQSSGSTKQFAPDASDLLSRRTFEGPVYFPSDYFHKFSAVRRFMGDKPVFAIRVSRDTDTRAYRDLFPEARVVAADPAGD